MNGKSIRWTTFLALSLSCGAAWADSMKPGLWEVTNQSSSGAGNAMMAEMQNRLASMSPEQRAQMEAVMAQHGMKLGGSGGGMTIKACITPEQAKRDAVPVQKDGNCTTTSSRSGNTVKISYACATQPPSSGQGEITFDSDTSYTMKIHSTRAGQAIDMQMAGHWVGADCGSVKPAANQ